MKFQSLVLLAVLSKIRADGETTESFIHNEVGVPQSYTAETYEAITRHIAEVHNYAMSLKEVDAPMFEACKNKDPSCAFHAVQGGCEANSEIMHQLCAASCKACAPAAAVEAEVEFKEGEEEFEGEEGEEFEGEEGEEFDEEFEGEEGEEFDEEFEGEEGEEFEDEEGEEFEGEEGEEFEEGEEEFDEEEVEEVELAEE